MTSKNKHMTLQERIRIQECLNKGLNFKAIGKRIGKSATAIPREVKKHLQAHTKTSAAGGTLKKLIKCFKIRNDIYNHSIDKSIKR